MKTPFLQYYKRGIAYATFKMMGIGRPDVSTALFYSALIFTMIILGNFM